MEPGSTDGSAAEARFSAPAALLSVGVGDPEGQPEPRVLVGESCRIRELRGFALGGKGPSRVRTLAGGNCTPRQAQEYAAALARGLARVHPSHRGKPSRNAAASSELHRAKFSFVETMWPVTAPVGTPDERQAFLLQDTIPDSSDVLRRVSLGDDGRATVTDLLRRETDRFSKWYFTPLHDRLVLLQHPLHDVRLMECPRSDGGGGGESQQLLVGSHAIKPLHADQPIQASSTGFFHALPNDRQVMCYNHGMVRQAQLEVVRGKSERRKWGRMVRKTTVVAAVSCEFTSCFLALLFVCADAHGQLQSGSLRCVASSSAECDVVVDGGVSSAGRFQCVWNGIFLEQGALLVFDAEFFRVIYDPSYRLAEHFDAWQQPASLREKMEEFNTRSAASSSAASSASASASASAASSSACSDGASVVSEAKRPKSSHPPPQQQQQRQDADASNDGGQLMSDFDEQMMVPIPSGAGAAAAASPSRSVPPPIASSGALPFPIASPSPVGLVGSVGPAAVRTSSRKRRAPPSPDSAPSAAEALWMRFRAPSHAQAAAAATNSYSSYPLSSSAAAAAVAAALSSSSPFAAAAAAASSSSSAAPVLSFDLSRSRVRTIANICSNSVFDFALLPNGHEILFICGSNNDEEKNQQRHEHAVYKLDLFKPAAHRDGQSKRGRDKMVSDLIHCFELTRCCLFVLCVGMLDCAPVFGSGARGSKDGSAHVAQFATPASLLVVSSDSGAGGGAAAGGAGGGGHGEPRVLLGEARGIRVLTGGGIGGRGQSRVGSLTAGWGLVSVSGEARAEFLAAEAQGNLPPDPRWRGHPRASAPATTPLRKAKWNVVQDIWPLPPPPPHILHAASTTAAAAAAAPAGRQTPKGRAYLVADSQREDDTHVLRLLVEGDGASNSSGGGTVTDLLRLRTKEGVYFTSLPNTRRAIVWRWKSGKDVCVRSHLFDFSRCGSGSSGASASSDVRKAESRLKPLHWPAGSALVQSDLCVALPDALLHFDSSKIVQSKLDIETGEQATKQTRNGTTIQFRNLTFVFLALCFYADANGDLQCGRIRFLASVGGGSQRGLRDGPIAEAHFSFIERARYATQGAVLLFDAGYFRVLYDDTYQHCARLDAFQQPTELREAMEAEDKCEQECYHTEQNCIEQSKIDQTGAGEAGMVDVLPASSAAAAAAAALSSPSAVAGAAAGRRASRSCFAQGARHSARQARMRHTAAMSAADILAAATSAASSPAAAAAAPLTAVAPVAAASDAAAAQSTPMVQSIPQTPPRDRSEFKRQEMARRASHTVAAVHAPAKAAQAIAFLPTSTFADATQSTQAMDSPLLAPHPNPVASPAAPVAAAAVAAAGVSSPISSPLFLLLPPVPVPALQPTAEAPLTSPVEGVAVAAIPVAAAAVALSSVSMTKVEESLHRPSPSSIVAAAAAAASSSSSLASKAEVTRSPASPLDARQVVATRRRAELAAARLEQQGQDDAEDTDQEEKRHESSAASSSSPSAATAAAASTSTVAAALDGYVFLVNDTEQQYARLMQSALASGNVVPPQPPLAFHRFQLSWTRHPTARAQLYKTANCDAQFVFLQRVTDCEAAVAELHRLLRSSHAVRRPRRWFHLHAGLDRATLMQLVRTACSRYRLASDPVLLSDLAAEDETGATAETSN